MDLDTANSAEKAASQSQNQNIQAGKMTPEIHLARERVKSPEISPWKTKVSPTNQGEIESSLVKRKTPKDSKALGNGPRNDLDIKTASESEALGPQAKSNKPEAAKVSGNGAATGSKIKTSSGSTTAERKASHNTTTSEKTDETKESRQKQQHPRRDIPNHHLITSTKSAKPNKPNSKTSLPIQELERQVQRFMLRNYSNLHKQIMIVPPINFNVAKMVQEKELHGCFLSETTPQSNARADEAKERILKCLQELPPDVKLFVMSGVIFDGYLSARPPKLPEAPVEKVHIPFPKPADMPAQYRRGEIDVLIFDKSHGVLILDTKAIGDTFEEMSVDESEKLSLIRKVLEKVLALIRKEREVILHLVSDVPCTIPVSAMLVLPNLKRSLLKKALDSYPDLRKELSSALKTKRPVEEECLCADDLPSKHRPMTDEEAKRFVRWWKRRFPDKEQTIDDNVYEQIIGRFCGPFSTVTVWTAEPPRADVRTLGRAVHETGLRFSAMVLYPEHRQILQSQERLVYISGPPGSGKTLVLVLKGLQWVQHGFYVCVLTAKAGQSPVSLVIQRQIQEALGCEAKGKDQANVDLDSIMTDHSDLSYNCLRLARRIRQRAEERLICLLMDEIHGELLQAIRSIVRLLPHCRLWCTGLWDTNCPTNFVHESLKVSVRCPPAVQAVLQLTEPSPNMAAAALTSGVTSSTHFGYVTHSTEMDERPLPTTGLRTKLMSHAPHGPGAILDCGQCGEDLAAYLKKELRVGKDLPPGDVLILTADTHNLLLTQGSRSSAFMTSLLKANLEMDIVTHLGHRELAFPAENKITLTTYAFVAGLERKVVVFLPEGSPSADTTERNSSSPEVSCDTDSDDDSISESYLSEKSTTDINTRQNHTVVDSSTSSQTDVTVPNCDVNEQNVTWDENCELRTLWTYTHNEDEDYYLPHARIETDSLQLAIENSSEDEDDDSDSGEEATSQTTNVDTLRSFDSRLREAVGQLSVANRERMWYAASRAVAHLVLFHFPEN